MRDAPVTSDGDRIRWIEIPGEGPARVYLHGLGSSSPVYYAAAAAHPLLNGRRSLLLDMLGFGISDRPTDFSYTLEEHADAVATALVAAGVAGAEVIGHSMGGRVAVALAARHPHLVSRLVLVDANLDPVSPVPTPGGSGILAYTEEEFVHGGGREKVAERVGPLWWATMRMAGPEALHRSGMSLTRTTVPPVRDLLHGLPIPREFLYPEADGELRGAAKLRESGVVLTAIPDCGHNIMLDNPEAFARAVADALTRR
ncbi:alpha/beta fold hydrolase [Kitasatospora sp. NPDC004240]